MKKIRDMSIRFKIIHAVFSIPGQEHGISGKH